MNPTTQNKLVWNAVPTIFAVPNPPKPVTVSRPLPVRHEPAVAIRNKKKHCNVEETAPLSSSPPSPVETPRKTKLKRKMNTLCVKVSRLKKRLNLQKQLKTTKFVFKESLNMRVGLLKDRHLNL